jgi:hypothetical protein
MVALTEEGDGNPSTGGIDMSVQLRLSREGIEVLVRSSARPGLKTTTIVPWNTGGMNLAQAVGAAAGAGAEHLCELYGDRLDPETLSVSAIRAFRHELENMERQNHKVPGLLVRVRGRARSREDRRKLLRLEATVKAGGKLLTGEVAWLEGLCT